MDALSCGTSHKIQVVNMAKKMLKIVSKTSFSLSRIIIFRDGEKQVMGVNSMDDGTSTFNCQCSCSDLNVIKSVIGPMGMVFMSVISFLNFPPLFFAD